MQEESRLIKSNKKEMYSYFFAKGLLIVGFKAVPQDFQILKNSKHNKM